MNPQNADSADDVLELDLPLFMTDKVVREVHEGRADLVGKQKKSVDALKGGGQSGITREFGKIAIDDVLVCEGTADGGELSRASETSEAVCEEPAAPGESMMPPDVAELLVRVLSAPEFESLLDKPVPTMLWTPETAGKVSDELAGGCKSFRVADSGSLTPPKIETQQPKESGVAPAAPVAEGAAGRTEAFTQLHQSLLQNPDLDDNAGAKRLELRLLLERPGKPHDLPQDDSSAEKSIWSRPRIKRTLERPAILTELIEKEALERQAWHKPPKLRGTLERPAVLEEMIQKEAEKQSWAKRPKLRPTLEHPGNLDDIMRDARALFLANLTAASTLYGRDDQAAGDSAVDKAIFQLVRPGGITESGVAIAPIILATIDGILFEYGKSSDDAGEKAEAAFERRPLSLNLAQYAQMNILAANAASASARLVAESGRALVKAEEMSNLTSGISEMVKDAISNRANSIQHAAIATLARAAAREDCAEQLVALIKQNVREAIETESRQTLKQTIKSVSSVQEQRETSERSARERAVLSEKKPAEPGKDDQDKFSGGGGGAAPAKADDQVRTKDATNDDVQPLDQKKVGALPALDAAIVAAATAETKRRPQPKVDDSEIDSVVKRQAGLEIGGIAAGSVRVPVVEDVTGTLTIRMIGRSGPDMAQLGELLANALTKRQFTVRLTAACNALRSESKSAAKCTTFDITMDGFGTGETVLVVLAKDQVEALRLQAQLSPHMTEGQNLIASIESAHNCDGKKTAQIDAVVVPDASSDSAQHSCDGAKTAPISAVVTPETIVRSTSGNEKPDPAAEKPASPDSGESAWDAFSSGCKLALNRLFGKK